MNKIALLSVSEISADVMIDKLGLNLISCYDLLYLSRMCEELSHP